MKLRHLLSLIPLLFGVWLFFGMAPYGIHVGEDGDLLYQMFATYEGKMPYVDFSTGYTPLYFYWHAFLFQLFGVDALVTRFSAAVANTLTLYFLYSLSARVVRPELALVTPLVFVGSLLSFPGDFATFNVPYPAWYNLALWLGSLSATLSYTDRGRVWLLALAGLLAGVSFAIKPNIGLFNIAALSFFIVWWHAPGRDAGSLTRTCWWILALATAAGVAGVFWGRLGARDFNLFPLPLLVLAATLVVTAQAGPGRPGFLRGAVFLLGGFVVATVPWLTYFLVRLGPQVFASDVLLIGSPYELFFYIPHRFLWTRWDQGVLLLAIGIALVPVAVHRKWIAWWLPFAGAALGGLAVTVYVAVFAPMPEGFQAAVASRINDLSFFIFQMVEWSGIGVIVVALLRHPQRRSRFLSAVVLLALSAAALSLGMYPRSDFMHLIISAPAAMILGTILLGRILRWWHATYAASPFWRHASTVILVAPVVLTAGVMASKTVVLATQLYGHYLGIADGELVRMDLPRASLIMEPGAGGRFEGLREAARYIERHTRPDEYVLPFPNLNLLCFLSGRLNPARKGYFHPGYPDHPVEAEIVSGLRQQMPKLVVSLHGHEIFLSTAPLYYFLLRDFVRTNYVLQDRVGAYDMLVRRDGEREDAPRAVDVEAEWPMDESILRDLDSPDILVQVAAAYRIRIGRDPRLAAELARRAVTSNAIHRLLMVRIVTEFGDERSVPALTAIAKRGLNTEVGQQATSALFFIVGRSILENYWFIPDAARARLEEVRPQLDRDTFRAWLRNRRADTRLRYVAAWGAGVLNDQEMVPYLLKMQENDEHLNIVATFALTKLGRATEAVDTLVAGLDRDDTYLPNLLIDLYRVDPDAVRPAILSGLVGGTAKQRETLAYVSSVLRDPALTAVLPDLREDTSPRVQAAAAWALETLERGATEQASEL